jgi:RNA polymerase sigma-70 factor (ECF subfamily)
LLVRRAQSGDQAAFTDLYRRYARVVHGLAPARIPPTEVEDLVQDVFLSAWKRWIRFVTRRRIVKR